MTVPSRPDRGLHSQILLRRGGFELDAVVDVPAGEVLAVLGPNGSGKTSLLSALTGLAPLTGGRIEVAGQLWDSPADRCFLPASHRRVGSVFQDYRLFPHLSVLDNVAFATRVRGTRRCEARRTAAEWLERVGLTALAGNRPAQLSGGQAQRAALARALAADPQMLLLDEPLAALDATTRLKVRSELRGHLADFPGPCVVVTHDPLDALVLADRLLVLEHGRITQQGPPGHVARHPTTDYVATLMGLNLYAGRLGTGPDHPVELDLGGALHAASVTGPEQAGTSRPPAPAPGARVLVAVAPTALTVHPERPATGSPRNVWPGTVTGLELLTDRIRVAVDGAPPALADITPAALAALRLAPGSEVWLSARATEVLAYPDPRAAGTRTGVGS